MIIPVPLGTSPTILPSGAKLSVLLPGKLTQVHPSAVWKDVILAESGWFTINYDYASKVLKDV